jgi:hypothetical protein
MQQIEFYVVDQMVKNALWHIMCTELDRVEGEKAPDMLEYFNINNHQRGGNLTLNVEMKINGVEVQFEDCYYELLRQLRGQVDRQVEDYVRDQFDPLEDLMSRFRAEMETIRTNFLAMANQEVFQQHGLTVTPELDEDMPSHAVRGVFDTETKVSGWSAAAIARYAAKNMGTELSPGQAEGIRDSLASLKKKALEYGDVYDTVSAYMRVTP